ncbi:uncharacterized protein LOC108737476 [Agrilus planipennis]|uniref:Uncharacterized protein LOC108737476 n=1 Tax=Agrilus planipennis TaxID=224129 RepID=A0A1W4X0J7_AGRPL|nr:uncharacterized protein LOC108737476 [Agrilus planipennis]
MQQVLLFGFICIWYASWCLAFHDDYDSNSNSWEEQRAVFKKDDSKNYPDYYVGLKYNDYPTIVPRKRTAIFLDRVMMALQRAIDEEEKIAAAAAAAASSVADNKSRTKSVGPEALRSMDLQRRGHQDSMQTQQKGRVYWRCYFNAITCFK